VSYACAGTATSAESSSLDKDTFAELIAELKQVTNEFHPACGESQLKPLSAKSTFFLAAATFDSVDLRN